MTKYFSHSLVALLCAALLGFFSCNKDNRLETEIVTSINNIYVSDACILGDSVVVVCGSSARKGKIIKRQTARAGKTITTNFKHAVRSLHLAGNVLWACGDSMLVAKSEDFGNTWTEPFNFDYFWEVDRSNLTKIYANQTAPLFAIGSKDKIFTSDIYLPSTTFGVNQHIYPLQHRTPNTDVYDFTTVSENDFFVAGYGNIFRYSTREQTMELQQVGNEIFCGITSVGNTIIACSFSGNIYTRNLADNNDEWHNTFNGRKEMRYIASTTNGEVLCVGNKNNAIFLSQNKGSDWKAHNLKQAKSIVALKSANNNFYLVHENGQILKVIY